jgi:hypothetical protein
MNEKHKAAAKAAVSDSKAASSKSAASSTYKMDLSQASTFALAALFRTLDFKFILKSAWHEAAAPLPMPMQQ